MTPIPILNPDLHKSACCMYGDWFALDLLVELWTANSERGLQRQLTRPCPACGATVTVDWEAESATFDVKTAPNVFKDSPKGSNS